MSLSRVCVVVCVLVLAGCAIGPRHQAIDAAAAARLRSVVIVQPPDQARYSSAISDPGPMVTGGPPALAVLQLGVLLALVADAQHKGAQLTAAVEPLQPLLQERLAELLREGLAAQGFEVEKGAIRLPEGPLKTIGDTPVQIALHTDVVATVTVSVLGEQ